MAFWETCFILLCAICVLFFWWTIDFFQLGRLFHCAECFTSMCSNYLSGQISLACSPIRELILIISNCNLFFKSNHILCHPHHIPLGVEWTWVAKWDDSARMRIVFPVPSVFRTQFILLRNVTSLKTNAEFLNYCYNKNSRIPCRMPCIIINTIYASLCWLMDEL